MPPGPAQRLLESLAPQMCRREGTISFRLDPGNLFDTSVETMTVFEVVAGNIVYSLRRHSDSTLRFTRATPGMGCRVATIAVGDLSGVSSIVIYLTWSPEGITLHVGGAGRELQTATGESTTDRLIIGTDGHVYTLSGAHVLGYELYSDGALIVHPTAVDTWDECLLCARHLAAIPAGTVHFEEIVRSNAALTSLVAGFEAYTKRRFVEIEGEGTPIRFDRLVRVFLSRRERETGGDMALVADAAERGISPGRMLVQSGRIDYQNYDQCKRAYKAGLGIRFGTDLGVPSGQLGLLQELIRHRHRVVHVSPAAAVVNIARVPASTPLLVNAELAVRSCDTFDEFIRGLHAASLRGESGLPRASQ